MPDDNKLSITFQNLTLDVYPERTRKLVHVQRCPCECGLCTNAEFLFHSWASSELFQFLTKVGATPRFASGWWYGGASRRNFVRIKGCWLVSGTVRGDLGAPPVTMGSGTRVWIAKDRSRFLGFLGHLEPISESDSFLVVASFWLPWMWGQLTRTRPIRCEPCPVCRLDVRRSGFLKRRSLLPEWIGDDAMKKANLDRTHRVRFWFCGCCGVYGYDLVEPRRPYWRVDRVMQKEVKRR